MIRAHLRQFLAVGGQIVLVSAGLAVAALAPPASGTMIAIPMTGSGPATTINLALAHGAAIEGTGPAGWVILRGDRARLSRVLRAHGIVLLAASSWLCAI